MTKKSLPSSGPAFWAWPAIAPALPQLPVGAITLIRLRKPNLVPSWERTVCDLVTSTLSAGLPAVYAAVDGYATLWAEDLIAAIDTELFCPVLDQDSWVKADGGAERTCAYPIGVPTLANVVELAEAHEAVHGSSLLVLDAFERARPFRVEGPATFPESLNLDADQVNCWRATHVRKLAVAWHDAPTVVVCHESPDHGAAGEQALARLIDVAHVVIDHHTHEASGQYLSISARNTLDEALPAQAWIPI